VVISTIDYSLKVRFKCLMSTSAPSTSSIRISGEVQHPSLDWRCPFWTLTMALVLAGAVAVLRMVFSGHVKWAETFALIGLFCWRYWAHATGLFQWRFNWNRLKVAYLLQAILNSFAWFVFYVVLLTWTGNAPTVFIWELALAGGLFCGFFVVEPSDSDSTRDN